MNNKGWGLNTFLGLLGVLTFCLIVITILSNQLYKSLKSSKKISNSEVSNYEIVPNDVTQSNNIKSYINLENKLKESAKEYIVNNAIYGHKVIISFSMLLNENYSIKLLDPYDNSNECNGYVIFNNLTNEYLPYLNCGNSYKTSNYNKYLE